VLLFRAYIPAGFMPAGGMPFQLEICPTGLSAQMPAHHAHHGAGHGHFEHCPFGSAPASGPTTDFPVLGAAGAVLSQPIQAFVPVLLRNELQSAHRARAPPDLA
jgi:hypothetical protein